MLLFYKQLSKISKKLLLANYIFEVATAETSSSSRVRNKALSSRYKMHRQY